MLFNAVFPTVSNVHGGAHRWQLCSLYPSSDISSASSTLGSFYWLDNRFLGAFAVPTPQLVSAGAPVRCGTGSGAATCNSLYSYSNSQCAALTTNTGLAAGNYTPADCANLLNFPAFFTVQIEHIISYGQPAIQFTCCPETACSVVSATCTDTQPSPTAGLARL